MDRIHLLKLVAVAAGAIAVVAVPIVATMAWLLNHPRD